MVAAVHGFCKSWSRRGRGAHCAVFHLSATQQICRLLRGPLLPAMTATSAAFDCFLQLFRDDPNLGRANYAGAAAEADSASAQLDSTPDGRSNLRLKGRTGGVDGTASASHKGRQRREKRVGRAADSFLAFKQSRAFRKSCGGGGWQQ